MPAIIDSHQHFWQLSQPAPFDYSWLDDPKLAPIRRDYGPPELEPLIQAAGIQKTIFVQAQHHLEESRWALRLAEEHSFIAGIVGWIDLASPRCEEQLVELKQHPKFVGVRHVTHDEPDDNFIVRTDVLRGLRVLERHEVPFDLLFYVKHLRHAKTLAQRFPDLTFVLDHLAKPNIKQQHFEAWAADFRAAAKYPNIFCKLSGMVTEADWEHWKPTDLRPYVQEALHAFGPQRLMFGSDWPVCEVAATYQQTIDSLRESLGPLSAAENAAIFGETAARAYKLPL